MLLIAQHLSKQCNGIQSMLVVTRGKQICSLIQGEKFLSEHFKVVSFRHYVAKISLLFFRLIVYFTRGEKFNLSLEIDTDWARETRLGFHLGCGFMDSFWHLSCLQGIASAALLRFSDWSGHCLFCLLLFLVFICNLGLRLLFLFLRAFTKVALELLQGIQMGGAKLG